jgi:hypothetical protein
LQKTIILEHRKVSTILLYVVHSVQRERGGEEHILSYSTRVTSGTSGRLEDAADPDPHPMCLEGWLIRHIAHPAGEASSSGHFVTANLLSPIRMDREEDMLAVFQTFLCFWLVGATVGRDDSWVMSNPTSGLSRKFESTLVVAA